MIQSCRIMKQHQRSDLGLVLNGDANRARTQPMRGAMGSRFAERDRQAAALGGRLPGGVEKNGGMRDRIENNAKLGRHDQRHRRFLGGASFGTPGGDFSHGALRSSGTPY